MGMGAFLGGIITLTPECLQPLMAPPLASTIKLTKNLIKIKEILIFAQITHGLPYIWI